jgi:predicted methyltransferase
MATDIHVILNLLSEVLVNRPAPLREFDQIYMRAGDMLLHVDHICHWFNGKNVVFVGDGDAIAIAMMHLYVSQHLEFGPEHVHVLDFDMRVVGSVERFAKQHGLDQRISASFYNVRESLPKEFLGRFDGFHTNPPFGKSNGGRSIEAFIQRGIEACGPSARGCVVLAADDETLPWTQEVFAAVQQSVVAAGFMISELKPKAHQYHLDDAPELFSSTMLLKRQGGGQAPVKSFDLSPDACANFYGHDLPLRARRVVDKTAAGRFPSRDHEIELYDDAPKLWSGA